MPSDRDNSAPDDRIHQFEPLTQTESTWIQSLWPGLVGLVLLASTWTSFAGLGSSLPLDAHEVFVARSTEEMLDRGQWLVPYFNDSPRLKKPPLEYWLVMAGNAATGGDSTITEFEARLPSALAGVGLTALAIALGTLLVHRGVGLFAGIMLATSSGFISYSHSARPEMVYAFLCTAGLLGFVLSERWYALAHRRNLGKLAATLGWIAFGLATLTKGPQLPIPMILGWLIGAWRTGTLRTTWRSMFPVLGILVYLIISFWWFVVIWQIVPNAGQIWEEETISRFVERSSSWLTLLDPYYLYHPIGMIVPWVFFVPGALLGPWLKRLKIKPGAMRMWWVLLIVAIVLSFSRGRRWYYMLPVLAPYMVLVASTAWSVADLLWAERRLWQWRALLMVHISCLAAAAVVLLSRHADRFPTGALWMSALVLIFAVLCIAALVLAKTRSRLGVCGSMLLTGVFAASAFGLVETRAGFWRPVRYEKQAFAEQVSQVITPQSTLLGWSDPWEEQQYYLHRPIPIYFDQAEFERAIAEADDPVWVLVDQKHGQLQLGDGFAAEQVLSTPLKDDPHRLQLWKVSSQ